MTEILVRPDAAPQKVIRSADSVTVLIGSTAPAGPPGSPGPTGAAGGTIVLIAAGTLSGHRAVVMQEDGTAAYADKGTLAHATAAVGVTLGAALAAADVDVVTTGRIDEPSWSWTAAHPVFIGAGGLLTQTAPTSPALFSRVIGWAISPTAIWVDPQASIVLT